MRNYAQRFYVNHLTLISSLLMSGLFSQCFHSALNQCTQEMSFLSLPRIQEEGS